MSGGSICIEALHLLCVLLLGRIHIQLIIFTVGELFSLISLCSPVFMYRFEEGDGERTPP